MTTAPQSLPTGVGLTALGMAYARAVESHRDDRLLDDPLAADFVLRYTALSGLSGGMVDSLAVRARFYDDVVLAAAAAGVRQIVVLAAGLDTRAYRLALPADVTVFEIDQPDLMAFKGDVLARSGRSPVTGRVAVGLDLRLDWAGALVEAGLKTGERVAWIAEGLLQYLTLEEARAVLDAVAAHSPAGSTFAFDHCNQAFVDDPSFSGAVTMLGRINASFRSVLDDPAAWLAEAGWASRVQHSWELAGGYGRNLADLDDDDDEDDDEDPPRAWLITATSPA